MTTRISRRRRPKPLVKQGLLLETLENRRMLAVFTVDTDQDLVDPAAVAGVDGVLLFD